MARQFKDAISTVGGISTSANITTTGNGSHSIGSTSNRFSGIYGANIYAYDTNAQHYASLRTTTVGTADTQGVGRLIAGNNVNAGTAGNAKGQVLLYGTNTGYTTISPGYNSTSNITITLPSATGSLPVMSKGDTSYWGLCPPDGGTGWIRTTTSGIIPSSNGSGALGTSSWQFSSIYGQTIYENGTALSSKYAAYSHGTHLTIGTGANNAAAGNHTHSYLPLSGGTLTGNVTLERSTANQNTYYVAKRTDTGIGVFMGIGTGGTNHGVYSQKLDKWLVYADESKCYLQGNADTATKLETARTLTIGATGKSFNGSGNVSWSLADIIKGQGNNYDTASSTIYFNNGGTSHTGRVSCYNNGTDDYVQIALRTSSETSNGLQIYPTNATLGSGITLSGGIQTKTGGITLNTNKNSTYYAIDVNRACDTGTATYSTARFGCINSYGGVAAMETRQDGTTVGYVRALPNGGIQIGSGKKLHIQNSAPTANVATGDVWIDAG